MVSLAALWMPIVLSAVVVFVASSLIHMLLGYHKNDWLTMPREDEVMAALVGQPGCAIDCAAIATFCESRLPKFAVPRYIDVLQELPRTENGKVQKYKLRERGVTPSTWDRLKVTRA